jgi:hypothetical protein
VLWIGLATTVGVTEGVEAEGVNVGLADTEQPAARTARLMAANRRASRRTSSRMTNPLLPSLTPPPAAREEER